MTGRAIEAITAWASGLEYWEQCALEKILSGDELTRQSCDAVVQAFVSDAGLAGGPNAHRKVSFTRQTPDEARPARVRLERLFNLRFVNALPAGQEIRFGPQLTLVFGDNGAGKSGYARPLGSAAFARGDRDVLPNAASIHPQGTPQADIELSWGELKQIISWRRGQRCSELRGFYLFDAESLKVHLTTANSLSFAPSGLGVLTRLAEVTDSVRERIREMIRQRRAFRDFGAWFVGTSGVTRLLSNLTYATDLEEIARLAKLTEDEAYKIDGLQGEIAQLRAQKLDELLAKRRREVNDLEQLGLLLKQNAIDLGEQAAEQIARLVAGVSSERQEAERSGIDQFRFDEFTQVGTDPWRQFLVAAKALADTEGSRGEPYPRAGDHCLLCRQALTGDAANLITAIWAFLKSEAEGRLRAARHAAEDAVTRLSQIDLGFCGSGSAIKRLLESDLPTAVPAIETHIEACSERRQLMVESLQAEKMQPLPPFAHPDTAEIQTMIETRRQEIAGLERSDTSERIRELEASLTELHHRQILAEHLHEVEEYVQGLRWAQTAENALGSTRHITAKYNELFKDLVTDRYVESFQSRLEQFRCRIRVAIETYGQKGETLKRVQLNPSAYGSTYSIEQILSDGEKVAVAIADFLTEASTDDAGSGIILDDPVTSLDNKWKGVLAECLTEYAKERQVIVFTHDLPFLYRLTEQAEKAGVDVASHWIREENGQPGFVYADNSPVCEGDYKSAKIARDCYSRAKDKPPREQQSWLQQGFGALRTSYEALVIFELFKGVVARFDERIGFDKLKAVRVRAEDVNEIVVRMAMLSRYIDAHLHSDAFALEKPTPETLLKEIDAFESIRKKLKSEGQEAAGRPILVEQQSKGGDVGRPKPGTQGNSDAVA